MTTNSDNSGGTQSPTPTPGGPWAWVTGLVVGAVIIAAISIAWSLGNQHGTDNAEGTSTTTEQTTTAQKPTTSEKPAEPATPAEPAAEGNVAAGEQFFAGTCQGCHSNMGQDAGVGPKLAGLGLDAKFIEDRVTNGFGAMPPGLASGDDLANVVAYVKSIQ